MHLVLSCVEILARRCEWVAGSATVLSLLVAAVEPKDHEPMAHNNIYMG